MIWRWENGDLSTERYVLLYAKALGISPDDLASVPTTVLVSPVLLGEGDENGDDPLKRREFGMAALGVLAGTVIGPGAVPASVSTSHVADLRRAAATLWTRDRSVGGTAQLVEANGFYTAARRLLDRGSYSSAVGGSLQSVTAELAVCAGFAAYDAADQVTARALLIEATLLAADDPLLAARAYSLLAMQSSAIAAKTGDIGRARESLRFSDRAAAAAKHEPSPRMHAAISMRQATAAAILGDEATIKAGITAAKRELDRGGHPADPSWTGYVTWSEIAAHEAMAMDRSGRPHQAARLLRGVLDDQALPPRNRALYSARLAASLAASGDRTEALAEGFRVLPALEGPVHSARAANELRPVRRLVAADSEFAARFDALASAT